MSKKTVTVDRFADGMREAYASGFVAGVIASEKALDLTERQKTALAQIRLMVSRVISREGTEYFEKMLREKVYAEKHGGQA